MDAKSVLTFYPQGIFKFVSGNRYLDSQYPRKQTITHFSSFLLPLTSNFQPTTGNASATSEDFFFAQFLPKFQPCGDERISLKNIFTAYLLFLRNGLQNVTCGKRAKRITWSNRTPTIREQDVVFQTTTDHSQMDQTPKDGHVQSSKKGPMAEESSLEPMVTSKLRTPRIFSLLQYAANAGNENYNTKHTAKAVRNALKPGLAFNWPKLPTLDEYNSVSEDLMGNNTILNAVDVGEETAVNETSMASADSNDDIFLSIHSDEAHFTRVTGSIDGNSNANYGSEEEDFKKIQSEEEPGILSSEESTCGRDLLSDSLVVDSECSSETSPKKCCLNHFTSGCLNCTDVDFCDGMSESAKHSNPKDELHQVFLYWLEQIYQLKDLKRS